AERVCTTAGQLRRGFRIPSRQLVVLSDNELFSRTPARTGTRRRRADSRAIDSFLDLKEGDLVVHISHGIARYRGMKMTQLQDVQEEQLILEFRDGVTVFV
ncbi:MAG: CarD family transcriptional regulator, partial [Planctomyces sp.]